MNSMRITTVLLCCFVLAAINMKAQKADFTVSLSNFQLKPGDSLLLEASYRLGEKALPPATLAVIIKHQGSSRFWQVRWPMLDGLAGGGLFLPPDMPLGNYTVYWAVQPRFFSFYGRVLNNPGLKSLSATVFDEGGQFKTFGLPVEKSTFNLKNVLFNNQALITINQEAYGRPLAIKVEAGLDSAFSPAAVGVSAFTVSVDGLLKPEAPDNTLAEFEAGWPFFDLFYQEKRLRHLSPARLFDSLYVSGEFKNRAIRSFDFLEDSSAKLLTEMNLETYLSAFIPGLRVTGTENGLIRATSKKANYQIFINESPALYNTLALLRGGDLAMVKEVEGTDAADPTARKAERILALYTRRGLFEKPDYFKTMYYVNGYTPSAFRLWVP